MDITQYLDELAYEYSQACRRLRGGGIYFIPQGKQCRLGIPLRGVAPEEKLKRPGKRTNKRKSSIQRAERGKRKTKKDPQAPKFNRHLPPINAEGLLNKIPEKIKQKNKKLSQKMIEDREREVNRLKRNFYKFMEQNKDKFNG